MNKIIWSDIYDRKWICAKNTKFERCVELSIRNVCDRTSLYVNDGNGKTLANVDFYGKDSLEEAKARAEELVVEHDLLIGSEFDAWKENNPLPEDAEIMDWLERYGR